MAISKKTAFSLKDLKNLSKQDAAKPAASVAEVNKPKKRDKDAQGRMYATGRRKSAVARV